MKGFAYWVAVQLVFDLGLFALLLFLLFKIKGLNRLLKTSLPKHAVHLQEAQVSEEVMGQGEGHRSRTGQRPVPARFSSFLEQLGHSELPASEPVCAPPRPEPGKSLRAQVENLAAQGLPPEEIAKRLNMQLAEVKVALDLSRLLSSK